MKRSPAIAARRRLSGLERLTSEDIERPHALRYPQIESHDHHGYNSEGSGERDVPCSGEGRFRITGEGSRYKENPKRERLPRLQKKIITRGFDLLKNEGEMIYATCTYAPEETESVVNHLLKKRDARLLPIHLDLHFEPGLTAWKRETYDRQLQQAIRFYPHRTNSVGFFMARIGKGI